MTNARRIAEEPLSFAGRGASAEVEADRPERLVSQPGAAEVNRGIERRFGDLKQGLTNQWTVQER